MRASSERLPWMPWSGPRRQPVAPTTSTWSLEDDLQQLQKTMLTMRADPALSDVFLVVEDIDVPVHKAVLAAWSRPFRAMFTLPMLESQYKCRVVIEDAEHKNLKIVLDYLYSGRVGLNDQNVMPVSALANRYEILPLMAQCESYMKWRLNPSNVCRHLLAAEDHQCAYMASFALDYLAVHFDEVHHASSRDFATNDFNALASDMVMRVLQHEGLTVDEETVFLAVDGWAKAWRQRRATSGTATATRLPSRGEQGKEPHLAKTAPARVQSFLTDKAQADDARSVPNNETGGATMAAERNIPGRKQLPQRRSTGGSGSRSEDSQDKHMREEACKSATRNGDGTGGGMKSSVRRRLDGSAFRDTNARDTGDVNNSVNASARSPVSEEDLPRAPLATVTTEAAGDNQAISVLNMPGSLPQFTCTTSAESDRGSTSSDLVLLDVAHEAGSEVPSSATTGGTRGRTRERGHTVTSACVASATGCVDDSDGAADASTGGDGSCGSGAGAGGGRMASLSLPPPSSPGLCKKVTAWPPKSTDGVLVTEASGGSSAPVKEEDEMEALPEEERACVDKLFEEIRFPLISTSFLCQVVEKSPSVSGSRVAERLLHEAYRFQAIRTASATDVDELFPGNHRVKYRGYERVLFGEGDGCVGTVDDYSSSLSEVHLVENVQRRDEKYWLPGQPEEAYVCIRLDRVRRITKFRFQNRYSEEFEVAIRRTRREEWQAIVPHQQSGGHKDVKELDLMRKRVKARYVKISLRGRKRSCYNTSVYWTELLGF